MPASFTSIAKKKKKKERRSSISGTGLWKMKSTLECRVDQLIPRPDPAPLPSPFFFFSREGALWNHLIVTHHMPWFRVLPLLIRAPLFFPTLSHSKVKQAPHYLSFLKKSLFRWIKAASAGRATPALSPVVRGLLIARELQWGGNVYSEADSKKNKQKQTKKKRKRKNTKGTTTTKNVTEHAVYILSYSRLFLIAHSRGLLMGKFSDMALL